LFFFMESHASGADRLLILFLITQTNPYTNQEENISTFPDALFYVSDATSLSTMDVYFARTVMNDIYRLAETAAGTVSQTTNENE